MSLILFQLLNAFVWSWVVGLIALGLNLVYGVLRVINVAHGAFYMLGAVVAWAVIQASEPLGWANGLSFLLALAVAPLTVGALAWLIERWALRPIIDRPILTIIATFGLMLVLEQTVQELIPSVRTIAPPIADSIPLLGLRYPIYRLAVAGLALATMLAVGVVLARTRFGLWAQAVRQNRELALSSGVPAPRVYGQAFGLGSALAALAGVLTAPIVTVDAQMGLDILIDAFTVVIVGGLGSLSGAVVAAFIYRMSEGLLSVWTDPVLARALALGLMASILVLRPQGLFGHAQDT
ncbi:MAG: branched-chain amino acid ABC transporter permease [Candidatus Bipolaricaulia bacterium]